MIKTIDEKTKILLESIDQSIFMKILLNGATVNNVRPQEFPEHFILKLNPTIETFKLKNKTKEYTNLEMEMKKLIRKYKIASLPFENDTND